MNNTPLSSAASLKLMIFFVVLIVTSIMIFGIIPALLICFGLVMCRRQRNFSHIEVSVLYLKRLLLLCFVLAAVFLSYSSVEAFYWYERDYDWYSTIYSNSFEFVLSRYEVGGSLAAILVTVLYAALLHYLFYLPLKEHRGWVEENPIFFKMEVKNRSHAVDRDIDIIKGEKLKQYSVADELLKWAKLKEDGHISEKEFEEARSKLMKKA